MLKCEQIESIPAGANPFHHDAYHMGTYVASNVAIMHATFESEAASYVIVVNRVTGERVRITFGDGPMGILRGTENA